MQPSTATNLWFYPCYRRSPFFAATQKADCQGYDIYNHMLLPAGYADAETEYWHLKRDVDLPALTGPGSQLVYAALNRLGFPDQIQG